MKSATYVQYLPRALTRSQVWFLKFISEENVLSKQHGNSRNWNLISNKLSRLLNPQIKVVHQDRTQLHKERKAQTSSKNTPAVIKTNTQNRCNKHAKTKQTTLPLLLPCLSLFLGNNISAKSQIYDSCTCATHRGGKVIVLKY